MLKIRKNTVTLTLISPYNINPLHLDISMHILVTVLYTFPKMLIRRICLAIKSFFSW